MVCVRCKKRMAVVFIAKNEGGEIKNEGYCIQCAKELGIKPVDDLMEKMGISDEELEQMEEQMGDLMGQLEESGFEPGGALPFPFMNMNEDNSQGEFEYTLESDSDTKKDKKESKKDRKKREANKKKFLGTYCTNLTMRARKNEIDRIIGRDKETFRALQILSRRSKNNPCLIGEPGVGKTAIAEGIAIKIAAGDVPFRLKGKELYLLDLTALVAGTQFRGQFESRVKGLVDEVKAEGNIILFIDEIHNLVGTGDSEGSMNAANILKPALSRGEIQVIGATTFNEYRKYIEKDAALERRFQPISVEEPSIEDTNEMVDGIKKYYEDFHRVVVTTDIIRRAVSLSERYITDRFLPDKAIDLLDEACSFASIQSADIEAFEALLKEESDLRAKLEVLESQADNTDFEGIAKIKSELIILEGKKPELEKNASNVRVTNDDLAEVIQLWTGISAEKIKKSEFGKISNLEAKLKEKVVGQGTAVDSVVRAMKRSRANLSAKKRPASFIFVGPTGVGKTELVKVLAAELFDGVEPLVRLDMSEYMEKHSVSKIVGSPPGYVGYDEAGQLTERIRRKPYSVILFDEIEKAHPDVLNVLLQILDEGKITDSHGRKVNFENTVIVMTSNAGSQFKDKALGFGKTEKEMSKEKVMKALSDFLRPEFIARVDEIVTFDPLDAESYIAIAGIMLEGLKAVMIERGIAFSCDKSVAENLGNTTFGSENSARQIYKEIQKQIEDEIANYFIINESVSEIQITTKDEKIVVNCI